MKKTLLAVVLTLCMILSVALVACQDQVTLTLYDNDGTTVLNTVKVNRGGVPTKPADPTKKDMTFKGWFITPTNPKEFDFTKPLEEDAKAYAQWQSADYQDDRDWVLSGTMNGWGKALDDFHFEKVSGKGNEFTITVNMSADDSFKCTVLRSDNTLDYNDTVNGANVGFTSIKNPGDNFEGKASLGDAPQDILCKVDGNYTLTLTTDPVNSNNSLTIVRNGDKVPEVEKEVITYHIKGKDITAWQDMLTAATKFNKVGGKLTLTVYLAEGDEFMFTQMKTKAGVSLQGLTFNIKNLDTESAKLFDGTGNCKVKTSGYYTFELDAENKTIKATLDTEKERTEMKYFLDGKFGTTNWGDYQKKQEEYKLTKNGEVYTIENVELAVGDEILVRGYAADATTIDWDTPRTDYGNEYLFGSVGVSAKDANIKIDVAGTYNISFNAYTQAITVAKAGKDVCLKGKNINNWEHQFKAEYKFVATADEAVYELTIEIEQGELGLAVYNIGESTGNGGWVGRDQLGTEGTANAMFGTDGNLNCQTAGTYRFVYNYKTNTLNIYTVTAE